MNSMRTTSLVALLTALTSSLCCVGPLLVLIAGVGGAASFLTWLEPLRPFMIAFSIGALGWAWYGQLKPQTKVDCHCEPVKPVVWQSKPFLTLMTVAALLLLTFPTYSNWLYQDKAPTVIQTPQKVAYVTIKGMTCAGCEHHVKSEVAKLKGITDTKVSYQNGQAVVKFDPKQTSVGAIKKAVAATGYEVVAIKTN